MKILLLTDIPPCKNLTAGLVLAQLCRFLPRGSLVCFTILNRHLQPDYFSDLDWIPIEVVPKPNEFGLYRPFREPWGIVTALPVENYRRLVLAPRLAARAAKFARAHRVEMIWAVLQGQTMLRVAGKLARKLGLPLVSQVWDSLDWWLQAHRVDPWNRHIARHRFDCTMRQSTACITASWAMAERYENKYGVRSVPVIAGHEIGVTAVPAPCLRNEREFVIGTAGQFYALEEWMNMLSALDYAGWQIAGRSVRLLMIGQKPPPFPLPAQSTFIEEASPAETIRTLADEADVLYCPYPFTAAMNEVARLSFPSKLPLYFAAGRPVVFHGPAYSSPAKFLAETAAAMICTELTPAAIYNEMERLAISPPLYEQTARHGRVAFLRDFTLDRMREQFLTGLGIPMASVSETLSPSDNREPIVPTAEKLAGSGIVRRSWKVRVRQRLKRLLTLIPPVRRYLAQKYILQDSWDRAVGERDALALEHGRLHAEIERERIERKELQAAIEVTTGERDLLRTERAVLQSDVENQRLALQVLSAERDRLHSEVAGERHRSAESGKAAELITAERDTLRIERKGLQSSMEGQLATLAAVAAARDQYLENVKHLQAEVVKLAEQAARDNSQYRDAALGKLTIVQSQLGTIQGNLYRLADATDGAISAELSRNLYLDLLEASLVGTIIKDDSIAPWSKGYDESRRELGRDWPRLSLTMIGKARMRNLREMAETVLRDGVPGDFLEAGAWRGGACIYMRGILKAYGVTDRLVWAADSFAGLPPPDPEQYPADEGDTHHTVAALAVSLEEVRENFARYGLLDEQVQFLKGWFKDTLPQASIERLALLRLDGDMYESTIQTMDALYSKVSAGGIVIVDDYILPACRQAIDDFRARHEIAAKLEAVDGAAVYWRKPTDTASSSPPPTTKRIRRRR
jgi:hypothetical protein